MNNEDYMLSEIHEQVEIARYYSKNYHEYDKLYSECFSDKKIRIIYI